MTEITHRTKSRHLIATHSMAQPENSADKVQLTVCQTWTGVNGKGEREKGKKNSQPFFSVIAGAQTHAHNILNNVSRAMRIPLPFFHCSEQNVAYIFGTSKTTDCFSTCTIISECECELHSMKISAIHAKVIYQHGCKPMNSYCVYVAVNGLYINRIWQLVNLWFAVRFTSAQFKF